MWYQLERQVLCGTNYSVTVKLYIITYYKR